MNPKPKRRSQLQKAAVTPNGLLPANRTSGHSRLLERCPACHNRYTTDRHYCPKLDGHLCSACGLGHFAPTRICDVSGLEAWAPAHRCPKNMGYPVCFLCDAALLEEIKAFNVQLTSEQVLKGAGREVKRKTRIAEVVVRDER